jgi:hypothetical protein
MSAQQDTAASRHTPRLKTEPPNAALRALAVIYDRHFEKLRKDHAFASLSDRRVSPLAQEDALAEFGAGIEAAEWLARHVEEKR